MYMMLSIASRPLKSASLSKIASSSTPDDDIEASSMKDDDPLSSNRSSGFGYKASLVCNKKEI